MLADWRKNGNYAGAHTTTRNFLSHWCNADFVPRPFWCQREAIETIIWLDEAGHIHAPEKHARAVEKLKNANNTYNEGISRLCCKMATGTGKTYVMAMLLGWKAARMKSEIGLNTLVLCPTTTIQKQLNKRLYGLASQLAPARHKALVKRRLRVEVRNFQAFQQRGLADMVPGKPNKREIAAAGINQEEHRETLEEMLVRILRGCSDRAEWIVINDEAHHCWNDNAFEGGTQDEDGRERQRRAVWFRTVQLMHEQRGASRVYDFSATPIFIGRLSEAPSLFPWVVSDSPLIEAIESGLVKIPSVPIAKETDEEEPIARNIYDETSSQNRLLDANSLVEPVNHYLRTLAKNWLEEKEAWEKRGVNPVMIVVANTIENASALAKWIAGGSNDGGETWFPGNLKQFTNVDETTGKPARKPATILVHSRMGEEDTSENEKRSLSGQAKIHCRDLFRGEDGKKPPTAVEIDKRLRALLATAGKRNTIGEHIRCIVSVSMLTEGWDASSVTHVFGFRHFGSELLCEQVTGRALRRNDLEGSGDHRMPELYAYIYGVPFRFMRQRDRPNPLIKQSYIYQSVMERRGLRIHWPILDGYRISLAGGMVKRIEKDKVQHWNGFASLGGGIAVAGVIGDIKTHKSVVITRRRAIWKLANKCTRELMQRAEEKGNAMLSNALFVSLLDACDKWWKWQGNPTPQELGDDAVQQVLLACIDENDDETFIEPVLSDLNGERLSHTGDRRFSSTKDCRHETKFSEIDIAPCDSEAERHTAKALDTHKGIEAWVRNEGLHWSIPWYDDKGQKRNYEPDFIARGKNGRMLIIEFKGIEDDDAKAKKRAAEEWWIPAVRNSDSSVCSSDWRYVYLRNTNPSALKSAITKKLAS